MRNEDNVCATEYGEEEDDGGIKYIAIIHTWGESVNEQSNDNFRQWWKKDIDTLDCIRLRWAAWRWYAVTYRFDCIALFVAHSMHAQRIQFEMAFFSWWCHSEIQLRLRQTEWISFSPIAMAAVVIKCRNSSSYFSIYLMRSVAQTFENIKRISQISKEHWLHVC